MTFLTPLWHQIFHRHIIQRGLPLPAPWPFPGFSIFELNAHEIEDVVRRTIHRHKNWSGSSPETISSLMLNPLDDTTLHEKEDFNSDFIDLKFIEPIAREDKQQGVRWLVTIVGAEHVMLPSMQWFQIWKPLDGRLTCLASRHVVGLTAWAVHESRGTSESILLVTHEGYVNRHDSCYYFRLL
jgi:hypothetical protein